MELLRRKKRGIKTNYRKCVFVGNSGVGKTSLLITHQTGSFPLEYVPRMLLTTNFLSTHMVDAKEVVLNIFDIPTGEEWQRHRGWLYPETDLFFICFSMVDHKSYEDVLATWIPEVTYHCPDVPRILVGTKRDLCSDPETIGRLKRQYPSSSSAPLATLDGIEMAERIGAIKFVECSASLQKGVANVFREAASVTIPGF